ncbi:hypothetical protein ERN12_13150 [Rhodobacteraceae bacterium]|nr:hypothetical protein ERN12_13150 [Paracoccaceae bacterium]
MADCVIYACASTATTNDQTRAALQVIDVSLSGVTIPRHFVASHDMKPKVFAKALDGKGRAALPCVFRASAQPWRLRLRLRLRQFAHCDAGGEW